MFGMRCSVIKMVTRRARTNVSIRLRRTSRASGRARDGSIRSLKTRSTAPRTQGVLSENQSESYPEQLAALIQRRRGESWCRDRATLRQPPHLGANGEERALVQDPMVAQIADDPDGGS